MTPRPPITRLPWYQRELARVLGRGRGEVRALQDTMALGGVLRFAVLFGVTVLVPALLLAYYAYSSIQAEELALDADLDRRADAVADQVQHDLEAGFARFERSAVDRLSQGASPLAALQDLSPYLLVAFRFESDGTLAAPFTMPVDLPLGLPTARYRSALAEGRTAEREQRWDDAVAAFELALVEAGTLEEAGQAAFSRARDLRLAGRTPEAEQAFADVYADFASARDERGFQFGDLATLARSEMALDRDPQVGVVALQDLVERLLGARWTIARPGEATIARRAVERLEGRVDADWLSRTKTRLDERRNQLFWAERLTSELPLLLNVRTLALRSEPGRFRYIERADSGTLWAVVWWNDALYAFAFDEVELVDGARDTARRATAVDPEIRAAILGPVATEGAYETVRSLAPWLPSHAIVAGPADPQGLVATKTRKRGTRIALIGVALLASAVGVVAAARLLARELDNARMKADFAANVSHELRSPITQIRLKGEALQLGLVYDAADRDAHVDAIVREAERLSRLVDNVLDFSAIERGAKKYTFRFEDLGEIVQNTVESGRNAVESSGLDIEVDVPDDLPVIWADKDAVSQVLTNLLSNAAKYGAQGGKVWISARATPDFVEVSVRDRGVGIAKADLPRIFERFYRAGDPNIRKYRGTGIGLTIVRYIVDEHGGSIRVDSAPGEGTTFTITFPQKPRTLLPPGDV